VDLETEMRKVLLALALLSNGSTTGWESSSGGGSARHYEDHIPQLGYGDAPHLYWAKRWHECTSDQERDAVLTLATTALEEATTSRADFTAVESAAELHARIVELAGYVDRKEAAVRARTSEAVVARAWREAGLDEYTGRPVTSLAGLPADQRRARVREYAATVTTNARAIARALGISYSTVLRDLDRRKD
jgi:hypothetical protein